MHNPRPFAIAMLGLVALFAEAPAHAAVSNAIVNVQTTGSSSASADLNDLVVEGHGSFGSASAAITYFFQINGPQIGSVVPIVIAGAWNAHASGTGIAAGQVTTGLDLAHGLFTRDLVFSCTQLAPCTGGPYLIHEQVLAGYQWTILLSAAGDAGSAGSFDSLVDPMVTIDPSFGQPASIEFSPNIGGVAPVPEPAAFATMLGGLLLMARLVRSRQRARR